MISHYIIDSNLFYVFKSNLVLCDEINTYIKLKGFAPTKKNKKIKIHLIKLS